MRIVDIKVPPTFTDEGIAAADRSGAATPTSAFVLSQPLESEHAM